MHGKDFSDILKMLMKDRGISGQKIAEKLGVSQKTISRYSLGEVVPNEEMQQRILEVIADIGGHPEDAEIQKMARLPSMMPRGMPSDKSYRISDDELEEMEVQNWEADQHKACQIFSLLETQNQWFVTENFSVYCNIDIYEIAIIEFFSMIPKEKQEFVLDGIQVFCMEYAAVTDHPDACRKAAKYLEMIPKCTELVPERYEKYQKLPSDIEQTELVMKFTDLLKKSYGVHVEKIGEYLPELISFDKKDWYLLFLIQVMCMHDKGVNTTYGGALVGDRVFVLIQYLERLARKSEKENYS